MPTYGAVQLNYNWVGQRYRRLTHEVATGSVYYIFMVELAEHLGTVKAAKLEMKSMIHHRKKNQQMKVFVSIGLRYQVINTTNPAYWAN